MKILNGIIVKALFLTFVLFFTSMALNTSSYQTQCVSVEDGYIKFKIWDTKSGKSYKTDQARKDGIHALLFSGIEGSSSCLSQPAILKNQDDLKKFKEIEKTFFSSKGDWTRFTNSSTIETTLPENLGLKNWKVYQVSVSKDALKKYLEEKSIIKSLNSGF